LARGDTERKVLDLLEVLDVAVKMTANALPRDASLRREYGTAPLVEADEGQLIQVFTNLLVNAYHAVGGERAPAREVRVVTFTGPDGSAVVEIHDTGYGIPRENLGRIFDPFFTTKGAGDGVGLGLSICHSIVRSFAGDITVDSDVGRGSVFRVTLPPTDQPRSQRMPIATPATASRKAHVLVIDDEEGIGKSLRRLLGQSHDVTVERDPRGAIARLGAEKFDVILCDITMPEMSGVDVYEAIKSTDPSAARRMVFMTGGTFSEETQGFLDSVDNIAIAKPFDASDLRRIVNDVSSR
jgi:CheY-like chemotaxis protein